MPVGGQLRTDQTTGLHADHNITNAALELTRLHPFSLANEMANETPECCDAQAVVAVGTRIAPRPPAQIPACAANAPGSSLGSNVGWRAVDTARVPAHI